MLIKVNITTLRYQKSRPKKATMIQTLWDFTPTLEPILVQSCKSE